MEETIKNRIDILVEVFEEKPWYGLSVMKILEGVDPASVNFKPPGMNKSIAIILQHMINWRIFISKKLDGKADYKINSEGSEDWQEIECHRPVDWAGQLKLLRETQTKLISQISTAGEEFMQKKVPGSIYTYDYLIRGLWQHDIFHLGQISYLREMWAKRENI